MNNLSRYQCEEMKMEIEEVVSVVVGYGETLVVMDKEGRLCLFDLETYQVVARGRLDNSHLLNETLLGTHQLIPFKDKQLLRCSSLDNTFHLIDLTDLGDECEEQEKEEKREGWIVKSGQLVNRSEERVYNSSTTTTVIANEYIGVLERQSHQSHNAFNFIQVYECNEIVFVLQVMYQCGVESKPLQIYPVDEMLVVCGQSLSKDFQMLFINFRQKMVKLVKLEGEVEPATIVGVTQLASHLVLWVNVDCQPYSQMAMISLDTLFREEENLFHLAKDNNVIVDVQTRAQSVNLHIVDVLPQEGSGCIVSDVLHSSQSMVLLASISSQPTLDLFLFSSQSQPQPQPQPQQEGQQLQHLHSIANHCHLDYLYIPSTSSFIIYSYSDHSLTIYHHYLCTHRTTLIHFMHQTDTINQLGKYQIQDLLPFL